MQILIGCAKTMAGNIPSISTDVTEPVFQDVADRLAVQLAGLTPVDFMDMLRVNHKLALLNWQRYQDFFTSSGRVPAVFGYDGMVFRKLSPATMSETDLSYANGHLNIGSFLYGLLRPLDMIKPYRLEGSVELPAIGQKSLFDFWKPILTDCFIEKIKNDGGILLNLASNEFRDIFDWKRISKDVQVITPEFRVEKEGRLKTVVIYSKMCRGAMARWVILNRVSDVAVLRDFEFEGFRHDSDWSFNLLTSDV